MSYINPPNEKDINLVCSYWFRTILIDQNISYDYLVEVVVGYYFFVEILRFSEEFKSEKGWELRDDRRCAVRCNVESSSYRWILPDIEPAAEGVHCWRIHVRHKKEEKWVTFGLSPKEKFIDDSFGQSGVWGIACNDCFYPNRDPVEKNNSLTSSGMPDLAPFRGKVFDVDLLWNAEKRILKLKVVGSERKNEVTFKRVGVKSGKEFLPHINCYSCESNNWDAEGSEFRIARMLPEYYDKVLENAIFGLNE